MRIVLRLVETNEEEAKMANLTGKELTALEDQIGCEETLIKKYEAMACLCNDMKIQQDFTNIANKHRAHYNTLLGFLQ